MIPRPVRRGTLMGAALAAALLAGGTPPAAASGRHELRPPTRALPAPADNASFEHGLKPDDLRPLLAAGLPEGERPGGGRVYLTIDERLQREVHDLFRRFDPPYGVLVAMEPATGKVRALVGYRKGGEADPWLPLKAIYPAASLIKVVTAAAALETKAVTSREEIVYRGGIYRITKRNLHPRIGRGARTMSLEEAIARSANTVFGKVTVDHIGRDLLEDYLAKFGFGEKIPFSLPLEVSQGTVPEDEYGLARTGAGFGDVYVSPLHMAMIMAAVGSRGAMPRPVLVERVEDADGEILYEETPGRWRDTVTRETADELLRMMVKTIEIGTGRRAFGTPTTTPLLQDMEVAGKTGSLSGWTPRMRFEWFAGVAPVNEPRLAVAALVVNNNHWRIKGSYVGKEAFSAYFGYPQSKPPAYRTRGRGKKGKAAKPALRKPARPRGTAVRTGAAAPRPAPGGILAMRKVPVTGRGGP